MLEEKLKGKRKILKVLSPDSSELNMPGFQILMRRANNCNATKWKCYSCPVPKIAKCIAKTRQHILLMALQKYGDTPQMKKAIDERMKKEKLRGSE
jgi:hypothetical protein